MPAFDLLISTLARPYTRRWPAVEPLVLRAGLAVFLGYYLGAVLGFALTIPASPVSTLWSPNSILMATSSLFDGDAHSAEQLPILLTGKGGGTIKTGRILNYLDKGDDNRKACSLHLSLMDRMGVTLDRFGDATERLEGL